MEDDPHISINVWLSGRSYRIRILPDEEEAVRKAVKVADDKIMDLRRHYAGKDDQDFVAMCLLMYSADHATHPMDHPALQNELGGMIERIDAALSDD